MKKFVLFFACFFTVLGLSAQLAGTYTIDNNFPTKKNNFNNLTEAVNALTFEGVAAEVVFELAEGTYYEPIVINGVSNELDASVTFNAKTVGTVNFVNDGLGLLVANSENLIFNNLTFLSTSTELSSVVILNNSNKVIFSNNVVTAEKIELTHASAISISNTSNFNIIDNNEIKAASGIEISRLSNDNFIAANNLFVANNGIAILSALNTTISGNIIKGFADIANNAIQVDGYVGQLNVSSNFISNMENGLNQLITYRPSNQKLSGRFVNNVMETTESGIMLTNNVQDFQIAYNSCIVKNGSVLSLNSNEKISGLDLFANNFINESIAPIINVVNLATINNANYNNVYSTKVGFLVQANGQKITSLDSWKGMVNAFNSISANPNFVTIGNSNYMLAENSPCIDAGPDATNIGVLSDFEGDERGAITEIGADEFNKTAYDQLIQSIQFAQK